MIAFACRIYIRTFVVRQFYTEDGLILFAVLALCSTTGLAISNLISLYESLAVILHGPNLSLLAKTLDKIPEISRRNNAAAMLWWCVIYPVKLAFLFLFRRLVVRLPKVYSWWWWASAITMLSWAGSIASDWTTCPFTTVEQVLSKWPRSFNSGVADTTSFAACSGPSGDLRVIRDSTITGVLDVVSDLIVLSFPVVLLKEIRIDARQKFILALSLCLSIVMIMVSIVRMSGLRRAGGEVDVIWQAFWQQQEASIAVIVVSVSAFRSLFVARLNNNLPPRGIRQSINDWRKKVARRRLGPTTDDQGNQGSHNLPAVPSPTFTGMSSVIRRL